ncbi:serine--tRNA ligase [Candidatus Woesearchaeota archaeon]|jgi:seryl-tRNA synthetase|nr:serine--tRNA ligase [Candidatus Woesearchaeota archaeon]MBT6519572.1 serine--tRNA ligase [Candidatus Woesearchaeota archaeon]MBT7367683.1 serine--tRNA ligase [Candidatus Woesearchaeota archaeon]
MFNIKLIRENLEDVKANLERRKTPEYLELVDEVKQKDEEWRKKQFDLQNLKKEKNEINKQISMLKKEGKDATEVMEKAKQLPGQINQLEEDVDKLKERVDWLLMRIPNLLHETVPYGADDLENVELKKVGEVPKFDFDLKSHAEIAEELGIADFERSRKIAGKGFYFLKGDLAMLNQAIIRFSVELLVKRGYTYVEPPLMMRRDAYEGVTDLADFENVMYKIEGEDHYMIATAEHPLAAQFMNETIDEDLLPLKFVGYSMCFRKEVGTRGVDEKGVFRTHQFNKVEQFIFCKPEDSWDFHEELQKNSEDIYIALGIPFRVVNICTGDIGIVAAKKYDLEAWMPRQEKYREVGSNSNCTDYQARRLNIKCGKEGGDKKLLHTLNNTAVATSRALVAVLENFQNADGTITIPEPLRPFMFGKEKIEPIKKV